MSNLYERYVSSYTLGALLRARSGLETIDLIRPRYNGSWLSVKNSLTKAIRSSSSRTKSALNLQFHKLLNDEARVKGALDAMTSHLFVRLACRHGVSNPDDWHPLRSSFAMGDGPLELIQLVNADIQTPQFAFLSAAYDKWIPDEVIHLAAAMQFSGFRSVIGTMWTVEDTVVCRAVKAFYEGIPDQEGSLLDVSRAAEALNGVVRGSPNAKVPFEQRIVLMHIYWSLGRRCFWKSFQFWCILVERYIRLLWINRESRLGLINLS